MSSERRRIRQLLEEQNRLRSELRANVEQIIATYESILRNHHRESPFAHAVKSARRLAATLTPRQREIVARIVSGDPNKAIAFDLAVSAKTIETHRARAMQKLEVESFADLVRVAMLAGLVPPYAKAKADGTYH